MKISPKLIAAMIGLLILLLAGTTWAVAQDNPGTGNDLTCATGQIAKFDGKVWACSDDLLTLQAELEAMQLKVDPETQVRNVIAAFQEAYQAGDVDKLMSLYADDVISLPPGRPKMEGKAALQADFEMLYQDFTLKQDTFKVVDLQVNGDTAFRRAEWTQTLTPKAGGEAIVETGKCMVGFKKVGSEWKIAWEIWNTDK